MPASTRCVPDARFYRPDQARDYARIERAIDYLRRHAVEQPDLAAVARHVHLSDYHFQRLFTRWAGVSPKRFLQLLTIDHIKARLPQSRSIAELAGEAGMSGPSRVHDLFVTLEAMSPGEYRERAAGLTIHWGLHDSPFGRAAIAATTRGICGLHFVSRDSAAIELLRADWPNAALRRDASLTAQLARRIFGPLDARSGKPLALLVKGSNFQVQVWRALLALPSGTVATYGSIANDLGCPRAARAVGGAVAANAIGWLIPCHRVIRATGEPGCYRWGEARKAALLAWEAAHTS